MRSPLEIAMMEESIGKFGKSVANFCNHLERSANALKESVERRPVPLASASTTFIQSLNRRVSDTGRDLNILDSMAFGTVSFEELLGHCNEVLKKNQNDLIELHQHIRSSSSSNYIPQLIDLNEEIEVEGCQIDKFAVESGSLDLRSYTIEEEDHLLDNSLSLKNFGISDVSLANIASQAEPDFEPHTNSSKVVEGETIYHLNQFEASGCHVKVSRDDYESLPKHMRSMVSWEDLLDAVEKMNLFIKTKKANPNTFRLDEIESLGLGFKVRSYLLLLIKMNGLKVENNEGVVIYRVL